MLPDEVIELVSLSHRGVCRVRNEDAVGSDVKLGIAVLADGMGGHPGGDIASAIAVKEALAYLQQTDASTDVEGLLVDAFRRANEAILLRAAGEERLLGMGTTLVALKVQAGYAWLGHVGDSRAYRFRNDVLERLTRDHTVAGMLDAERARPLSADAEPLFKGMLLRALGVPLEQDCEVTCVGLQHGDLLMLCSDGLHDVLSAPRLRDILADRSSPDLVALACALVEAANEAGGPDNVSVVLVRYHAPDGLSAAMKYLY